MRGEAFAEVGAEAAEFFDPTDDAVLLFEGRETEKHVPNLPSGDVWDSITSPGVDFVHESIRRHPNFEEIHREAFRICFQPGDSLKQQTWKVTAAYPSELQAS